MNRCVLCGAFLEADKCRGEDQEDHPTAQPGTELLLGRIVRFPWPANGETVLGIIVNRPDKDGMTGIAVLTPDVRVPHETVEEIP